MFYEPTKDRSPLTPELSRLGLICVIFFTVSGGAYGLEPLVGSLNPGWAVMLIILTPLFWCLPIAWMVSELSSALPLEGGYYIWVREGLGDFWGFQEGWWTLCYTVIDMAIYPVLFVDYLAYFYPWLSLSAAQGPSSWRIYLSRWLIALAVIATGFVANWRGIRIVGRSSTLTLVLVLSPFALLVLLGLHHWGMVQAAFQHIKTGLAQKHQGHLLALGVATVLWNYSGWDNISTFAAEVKQAGRNYPFALAVAQGLILAAYVLPVVAGIGASTSPALWSESAGWPAIARLMAGNWLAIAVATMGVVSAWSMFNSQLLYVSRIPYAMACDGWLPSPLMRISKATGVPINALALACIVSGMVAALPFTKLVVIDILLYSAELFLEFLALMALRIKEPEMQRPFRVPGGWPGLIFVTISPMALALVVAAASMRGARADLYQMVIVPVVIASGIIVYFCRRNAFRYKEQLR
jgi:amino acid transporter